MKLILVRRKTEVPNIESFIFEPTEPLTWEAGQFLHCVLPHEPVDDRGTERWFTISSAPFEKEMAITTRLTEEKGSSFKTTLNTLKIGDAIEVPEIGGDFTIQNPTQEYVFIAGGIGITPFHSILKEADHTGIKLHVTLLYANRDHDIPFKKELEKFAKNNPYLKIRYIISPERISEETIKDLPSNKETSLFYVSGPEPMVENLGNTLKSMGIPESHIKQDYFPGYASE